MVDPIYNHDSKAVIRIDRLLIHFFAYYGTIRAYINVDVPTDVYVYGPTGISQEISM